MIRVLVEDLAFVSADAVLRPANELLEPVTPAMSRLDNLAGAEFTRLRRVQTPLDPGAAVVTGAGSLSSPFVLHIVIRSQDTAVTAEGVQRALTSAWQRAADWGLARLAAPLVGAGAGALDREEAARILAESFRRRTTASGFPSELTIVVDHADERALVEQAIGMSS
ncbi:MAG: macro domain-containing protein [Gemmatimonadota bacterium]